MTLLCQLEDDPRAKDLPEIAQRTYEWPAAAFITASILEAVGMYFSANEKKSKLQIMPFCTNAIAGTAALSFAFGFSPTLIDFNGRRLMPARYLEWSGGTSTLLRHSTIPQAQSLQRC
jgi:hypothetical protein